MTDRQPGPRPQPGPRRLSTPAALLLAVPLNAALGVVGYAPYIVTVVMMELVLLRLGLIFVLLVVLIPLVGLYVPLLVSTNRAVLRRAGMPVPVYLTVAVTALLAGWAWAATRLWGFLPTP